MDRTLPFVFEFVGVCYSILFERMLYCICRWATTGVSFLWVCPNYLWWLVSQQVPILLYFFHQPSRISRLVLVPDDIRSIAAGTAQLDQLQ